MILLHLVNPDLNQRRFYRIENGPCIGYACAIHRTWGRIGRRRSGWMIVPCADQAEAQRLAERLIKRKLKRGYIMVETEEETNEL
jgi:predicted DNA-binding WGR domain protein